MSKGLGCASGLMWSMRTFYIYPAFSTGQRIPSKLYNAISLTEVSIRIP
jgi:hypothetical protein